MSPFEQADTVLFLMFKHLETSAMISREYIWTALQQRQEQTGINRLMFEEIINRLIDDKYIRQTQVEEQSNEQPFYNLTFNGKIFVLNKGYVGEVAKNDAESIRLVNVEKAQRAYENRQIYLTAILAAFAFLSVCTDIAGLVADEKKKLAAIDLYASLFLFLFGIIAGIIIYMLISEGLSRRKKARL